MSLFDFFGRNTTVDQTPGRGTNGSRIMPQDNFAVGREEKESPLTVCRPHSFKDVENIIDILKTGKQVMLQTESLQNQTKFRVLDLLSGAIYALGGGVYEVKEDTYIFTPKGISVRQ